MEAALAACREGLDMLAAQRLCDDPAAAHRRITAAFSLAEAVAGADYIQENGPGVQDPHDPHRQWQFRFPPRYAKGPTARSITHMFAMRCRENGIGHRFTKVNQPWTNGQVERMSRTIKDATVKRYHYDSHEQLQRHLDDFVCAYNFGPRLKRLRGLTPSDFICKAWTTEPQRFTLNPLHQMPGRNT